MTVNANPDAAKNGLLHRLMGHLAKSATASELADMLSDTVVAKGTPEANPMGPKIEDLWTGEKGTEVGTNLEIGGGVASKGNEPTKIISKYSTEQAAQMGAMADATRLGEMVNGLEAVKKAVSELVAKSVKDSEETALMKAILIKLAKAEPEKDASKEAKVDEKEGKEDGEYAKAVNAILAKAQPLVTSAQERIETAKAMTAEGFTAQAETARCGAAEFIVKARKLVDAAVAMDPTNAAVIAISKAMSDMKDEFGNKKSEEKEETAKAETAKSEPVALAPEHLAQVTSLLEGFQIQKSTIAELMDKLAGRPLEVAKGKPELPVASQTTGIEGIQSLIRTKEEAGELTPSEAAVAMDLSVLREADVKGLAPKGVYEAKRAVMPSVIKAIFQEAA